MPARRRLGLGAATLAIAPRLLAQSFGDDVAFVKKHTTVVVLADARTGARVAIAPDLQGRVLTSTSAGEAGPSFGWINRALFASRKRDLHFNAYGGEDRFWLGPEGGQFGLFFKPGDAYDLSHWFTPKALDTELWPIVDQTETSLSFRKDIALANASGTQFVARVDRRVRLVPAAEAWRGLGVAEAGGVSVVAHESENKLTNAGRSVWTKENGLVSVWILGMFQPTPATTVVIPFKPGPEARLGPIVHDAYFGKIPEDRLVVKEHVLFFRADGLQRGKLGLASERATATLASYDGRGGVLTVVQFTLPPRASDYVNSMWETQKDPFGGDVVNSYNDGPPGPGQKPLGPFYELETSSPAAALQPGASIVHRHRTLHLSGERAALDAVARKLLGVGLDAVEAAFPGAGK
jgi:hypothetical protein